MQSYFFVLFAFTLLLSGCATKRSDIVLLPSHDNRPSAVVVYGKQGNILLDQPYRSVSASENSEKVVQLDEKTVLKTYGEVLKALPERPIVIVLYFKNNSDELTEESQALIVPHLFNLIERRKFPEISIIGYADTVGSDELNDRLSYERAKKVEEILLGNGLKIKAEIYGLGKRLLRIKTADNVEEPRNRRVEVTIR